MYIHPRSSPYNKKVHSFDGIIEAVKRDEEGNIVKVRYYRRHGAGFSDVFIMTREELVAALEGKKKFIIGQRVPFMGGLFDLGDVVKLAGSKDSRKLVAGTQSDGLELASVPVF